MMGHLRFAMIGSGKVASHLAPALVRNGITCATVYSPTFDHAKALSDKIGCQATSNLQDIIQSDVDFVLLSIKDDALSEVASQFPKDTPYPLIHTSGSTPLDVLAQVPHHGVLYPMQTFSKERVIDVQEVPFFIEANDDKAMALLRDIIKQMGIKKAHELSSENRERLHLSSVFACNFTNHLFSIADELLEGMGLSFDILQPLLEETLSKALENHPKDVQTGPAVRGDKKTMNRHLGLLSQYPNYQNLYQLLSQSIYEQQNSL